MYKITQDSIYTRKPFDVQFSRQTQKSRHLSRISLLNHTRCNWVLYTLEL